MPTRPLAVATAQGSTNLTAGIRTGLNAFSELPEAVAARPQDYALLLAIATDGQPSNDTHPPGGPTSYASYTAECARTHRRPPMPTAGHVAGAAPSLVRPAHPPHWWSVCIGVAIVHVWQARGERGGAARRGGGAVDRRHRAGQ